MKLLYLLQSLCFTCAVVYKWFGSKHNNKPSNQSLQKVLIFNVKNDECFFKLSRLAVYVSKYKKLSATLKNCTKREEEKTNYYSDFSIITNVSLYFFVLFSSWFDFSLCLCHIKTTRKYVRKWMEYASCVWFVSMLFLKQQQKVKAHDAPRYTWFFCL